MSYCPDCGVEIGNAETCPLCGIPNPRRKNASAEAECGEAPDTADSGAHFLGAKSDDSRFTPAERSKIAFEIATVGCAIALAVIGAVDLLVDPGLSWSLYPIASLVFVWSILAASLAPRLALAARLSVAALALPLFLLCLGFLTGSPAWAINLAVPLAVAVEILVAAVSMAMVKSKRKGLNLIAFFLLGAGVLCLAIEFFLDLYLDAKVNLIWSAITATALVPIAAFLLYLHFRVARTTSLRRLFRL